MEETVGRKRAGGSRHQHTVYGDADMVGPSAAARGMRIMRCRVMLFLGGGLGGLGGGWDSVR